ncbi:VanZ family protein [Clostridium sp. DL1XJH146]
MSLHEIAYVIKGYFFLGLVGVVLLGTTAALGYFIIYKRVLKGKKRLTFRQVLPAMLLVGYIIMVLGVTCMSRGNGWSSINLHLFSSYKEAWNTFRLRSWQFIIFNIIMFVPLGILLPSFYQKFRKPVFTIGAGLVFTVFVECFQLLTNRGIFELDDLFNNIIGTILGYCIVMIVFMLRKANGKKLKDGILYFLPILIIVGFFTGIFIRYNLKEYGNLPGSYIYKINLENVDISLDTELTNKQGNAMVYKAPICNEEKATIFAKEFFNNMGLDISNIEVDAYSDEVNFWIRGDISYSLNINYLNSTYSYKDFSAFDEGIEMSNCKEAELYEEIEKYRIEIPETSHMESTAKGQYQLKIEKYQEEDMLTEGTIYCSYYSDGTIKSIYNNLITYQKVKEAKIISEQEAYNEFMEGKFSIFSEGDSISSISITEVNLDYELDTKGFYQPVYIFEVLVNGNKCEIMIPALY